MKIGGLSSFSFTEIKPDKTVKSVVSGATVYLKLPSEVNLEYEKFRLTKKLEELNTKILSINGRLMNQSYLAKAEPEIIEKDKNELFELEKTKVTILSHLEDLN